MSNSLKVGGGWRVLLALATLYLVWGSTFMAIKVTLADLPPFTLGAARLLSAALLMLGLALAQRQPLPTLRQLGGSAVSGVLLVGCGLGALVWAEQSVSSGLAALLQASLSLFVVAIGVLTGRQAASPATLAGTLLGFAGVAMLVAPQVSASGTPLSLSGAGEAPLAGCLVILAGSFLWACGMHLNPRLPLPSSGAVHAAVSMLVPGLGLAALAVTTGEPARLDLPAVSAGALWALAYLSVFGSCVAYTAFAWLSRTAPPALVSTFAFVNPVVAVVLGALLLGERLDLRIIAGGALVIGAVVLIIRGQRPAPERRPAEPIRPGARMGLPLPDMTR